MICICKTFANGKFSYWKRRNVKIQFAGRGVRRSQSPQCWHFFPEGQAPSTPRPYFMDRQKRGQKLLSMAVQEKLSKRGFHKGQGTYPRPKGHKFCWFSPAAGQLATNCASLLRTENSGLSTNRKNPQKQLESLSQLVPAFLPTHWVEKSERAASKRDFWHKELNFCQK